MIHTSDAPHVCSQFAGWPANDQRPLFEFDLELAQLAKAFPASAAELKAPVDRNILASLRFADRTYIASHEIDSALACLSQQTTFMYEVHCHKDE